MRFNKIYVGNLSLNTDEDSLKRNFEEFGPVGHVSLVKDKDTGKSRGFAFITFEDPEDAAYALEEMNGSNLEGSTIKVNQAFEREPNKRFSSGGSSRFNQSEDPLDRALFEAQKALEKAYTLYHDRKRR